MEGLKLVLSILIFTFANSEAQICPPYEALQPCGCLEDFRSIFCLGAEIDNLKEIFDRASEYVNDGVEFQTLSFTESRIGEVQDGAVEHLKFHTILVRGNTFIGSFSPRAFNATRNTTRSLQFALNTFPDYVTHEWDFFDLVKNFEKLETVGAVRSGFRFVPSWALENLKFLESIALDNNNISEIGFLAFFTGSNNLKMVSLTNNSIPSSGFKEGAFGGISINATVVLECNRIEFLEQKSFQVLLDRAATVKVGGVNCAEQFKRLYCDERADWICENEGSYRPKLEGFLCKEESRFENIWEYCAARNKTVGT